MTNDAPPPAADGPGWPQYTPEQLEEARRHGFDFENAIDGSAAIQDLIAELEARDPGSAGTPPGGRS